MHPQQYEAQVELRWKIARRLGLALCIGVGAVGLAGLGIAGLEASQGQDRPAPPPSPTVEPVRRDNLPYLDQMHKNIIHHQQLPAAPIGERAMAPIVAMPNTN